MTTLTTTPRLHRVSPHPAVAGPPHPDGVADVPNAQMLFQTDVIQPVAGRAVVSALAAPVIGLGAY